MNIIKKLRNNKVASAGIGYTVGNYLLKGINFLTIPIFTRLMTTADYGIYSTYMTYDAIVSVFIAFALHSSLKNAKYKYGEKFDDYVSSILILPVLFLMFLSALVNIFGGTLGNLLELNRIILNILFVHAFANSIVTIYNGKLGIDYRYKDFLKISLVNTAANILLSLVLMFTIYTNERYMGRIAGSALPLIFIAVYIYWKSFGIARPRIIKEYWKFGLTYSLPIIPHGISQIILSSFDRIMIKNIVGTSEAGIYSLGCNIEQLVKITTTSLDTVWGPWFYERMNKKDHDAIKKCATWYAYGMFVFLSCLIFVAPEIVKIMGAAAYQDAKYVVIPLLACTFFTFLYTLPATVEYFYQKTKMIALGTMGAAVLNIVLNSIFIHLYGYQAAAYTTLASYVAYFCFHYLIAKKIAGIQLFHTKALVGFGVGIFVVSAIGLLLIEAFLIRWGVMILFFGINVIIFWKKILPQLKG